MGTKWSNNNREQKREELENLPKQPTQEQLGYPERPSVETMETTHKDDIKRLILYESANPSQWVQVQHSEALDAEEIR